MSATNGGRYGLRVTAVFGPPNMEIVFHEAVETAVGSGTPGTYTEVARVSAVVDDWTLYEAFAPNDGKLRWLKARAEATSWNPSPFTTALAIDPWSATPVTATEALVTPGTGVLRAFGHAPAVIVAAPAAGGTALHTVGATFDGGGEVLTLTDTTKVAVVAVADGTISRVRVITTGGTGSVTLGVKSCALGSYPGSLADLTGGNDVVISSNDSLDDATLSGWTTDVTAGDAFEFELKAVSTFEQVTIIVEYA